MKELSAILDHLVHDEAGSVLATLVTVAGSSYRRPGARLLITPDGGRIGSISGGCLEEDVIARAEAVASTGRAELVVYDTTSENDLVWGVGLGCHGVVQVLIEKLPPRPAWAQTLANNLAAHRSTELVVHWDSSSPLNEAAAKPPRQAAGTHVANSTARSGTEATIFRENVRPATSLVIFGAGDDARPLVRMAAELGWKVIVADPRPAFATAARFPEAATICIGAAHELVDRINPSADSLAVVMTHHYVHDVPLLRALLPRPLAYLGLLGPKKRADKILQDLAAEGVAISAASRARLHAPVGLDLGADAPEEVALSIIAEMQAVLTGREARPLRERIGPIHD